MSFQEMSYRSDFIVIFYTYRNLSIYKHFELGFESFSFKFQTNYYKKKYLVKSKNIFFKAHDDSWEVVWVDQKYGSLSLVP